jgi:hypothetical protein
MRTMAKRYSVLLKDAQERGDRYAEVMLRVLFSRYYYLPADDPAAARENVRDAIALWSQSGFHIQHLWELWAGVDIAVYEQRGALAWTHVHNAWPALEHSFLLRVQFLLIGMLDARGRAALAAAGEAATATERRRLLGIAARAASRIEREHAPWGLALATLLRAGLAVASSQDTTARSLLNAAIQEFERLDMALLAAVARRRLGELVGGADGMALISISEQWMRTEDIRDPARIAYMLAPWKIERREQ